MSIRAEHAWAALATAITLYELTADDDQLLSHAVDRWQTRHPITTRLAIAAVALHLANALDHRWLKKADPLTYLAHARTLTRRR